MFRCVVTPEKKKQKVNEETEGQATQKAADDVRVSVSTIGESSIVCPPKKKSFELNQGIKRHENLAQSKLTSLEYVEIESKSDQLRLGL